MLDDVIVAGQDLARDRRVLGGEDDRVFHRRRASSHPTMKNAAPRKSSFSSMRRSSLARPYDNPIGSTIRPMSMNSRPKSAFIALGNVSRRYHHHYRLPTTDYFSSIPTVSTRSPRSV